MSGSAPAFNMMDSIGQSANGQYNPPVAAAPSPATPVDPGSVAATVPPQPAPVGVVPPPSSPPSPAAPAFDMMGALDAATKGQFKPTTPIPEGSAPSPSGSQAKPDAPWYEQVGSGLAQGAVALPNTVANLPIRGINALFGTKIPQFSTNPFPVQATSEPNKMLQGAGQAVGSLLPMVGGGEALEALAPAGSVTEGVGSQLAQTPLRALPSVAAGGAAGQAASDAVPQPYKGIANLAGNIAGGGAEALAQEGSLGALSGVGRLANNLGVGRDQSFSEGLPEGSAPLRATSGEASQAVAQLRKAGGANLGSRLSQVNPLQDAHDALEDKVNSGTASPEEVQQLASVKTALAARGQVIGAGRAPVPNQFESVPKDRPTTLQAMPDAATQQQMNQMATLDKQAKLRNPAIFQTQATARNAAQVNAIRGLAPTPDTSLGDYFVKQATAAEDNAKTTAQAGQQNVQGATAGLGSTTPPEVTGQILRSRLEAQGAVTRQNTSDQFWSQVDPNLTHPAQPTKALANVLLGNAKVNLPPNASPEMQQFAQKVNEFSIDPRYSAGAHPAEADILGRVTQLPDYIPYRGTAKLLSGISDAKAALTNQGMGQSQSMVRLRMIEGSLQDAMSGDAQQRITDGQMFTPSPETGENGAALAAARQQSAVDNQTYRQGVVGDILDRQGYGEYKVPDLATVAKMVVTGGENESQRLGQALAGLKGDPQGTQALKDAFVYDATKRGVLKPDGTVDASKFPRWMTPGRQRALAQFPDLRDQLTSAAALQTTADTANANAQAALKAYNSGAASKFIGNDTGVAVRNALNMNDRGQTLGRLIQQVKPDAAATEALRGHVAEEIVNKFAPEFKASAGQDAGMLPNQRFREFLKDNTEPLRRLFGGQGIQNFDYVKAGLQASHRAADAIPGTQTTPLSILANMGHVGHSAAGGVGGGVGLGIMALLGEHSMESLGGAGALGAAGAVVATKLASAIRAANINTEGELVNQMMLHPSFARAMLQRFPAGRSITAGMANNIERELRAIMTSRLGSGNGQAN